MERSDVFLSYRRKDVDFVKQLDAALKNTGREVWVDWEDIPPGVEGFADEIQRGIEGADAFMAVLSPSYLESEYCLMELREALKLKKKIIPVVYQKFDPLPPPDGIGHINWVYFTPHAGQANTFAESFPRVVQALEADFTHIREHTRLLLRALDWDKHQRNGSFLLNGTEIEKAESWQVAASSKDPVPTQLHGEYILLSRRRQRQQQQRLLLVIAGLLVLAGIAAVLAVAQAVEARRQEALALAAEAEAIAARNDARRQATVNNSVALASAALQPGNETIALTLALEATRIDQPPAEVFSALMSTAYRPGRRSHVRLRDDDTNWLIQFDSSIHPDGQSLIVRNQWLEAATGRVLREFADAPLTPVLAAWLADGQRVIIAGDEGFDEPGLKAGLFDASTGALLVAYPLDRGISQLWLSQDERRLATFNVYSSDMAPAAQIFDVETGEMLQSIPVNSTFITFNPALTQWAEIILPQDDTPDAQTPPIRVHLRDTTTGELRQRLELPINAVAPALNNMTFSPDGTTLALLVNDTVFVYDTVTGREVRSLDILQPFRLNYSPDGQTLIIATMFESRIVLWHLADASTALLKGHERSILFADFTADGATAISLDSGGNLMTWDTRHRDIDHIVPGTEAWLNSAAEEVIVVDRLDTLSLTRYDLKTYAERGRVAVAPSEYVAEFSEDFQYVLLQEQVQDEDTGSMDGTLRYRVLDLKNSTALATIVLERPSGDASTTLTAAAHLIPGQARALVFRREDVWDDASASYSGTAEWLLWDFIAGTLEPYAVLNTAAADAVALNAIGPAGQWVDIALPDPETYSKPQRLDLTTGAPLEFRPAAPATIPGDDTLYAEVLEDGRSSSTLQLKAVATGEVVETITLEGSVYSPNVMIDPQQNQILIFYASGGGGGGAISPSLGFFAGGSSSAFYLQDRSSGHILRDFGDDGLAVIGFAENYTRLIAVTVEGVVIYRQDTLESLVAWTCANRYITPLTELQQGFYRITATEGVCSAAGA